MTRPYAAGAVKRVLDNRYERDPHARQACLDNFGHSRCICGFNFSDAYGPVGEGVITVHHILEISKIGPNYKIDPKADLIPVCDNCHRVIHQSTPALAPDALRQVLQRQRKQARRKELKAISNAN